MLNQPEDDEFYEESGNELEVIKFSSEVQHAIEQVSPQANIWLCLWKWAFSKALSYLGCSQ